MKTDEILERLDTLGKMLYEKFGTDSYEARCHLHDTKEMIKEGQKLSIQNSINISHPITRNHIKEIIELSAHEQESSGEVWGDDTILGTMDELIDRAIKILSKNYHL